MPRRLSIGTLSRRLFRKSLPKRKCGFQVLELESRCNPGFSGGVNVAVGDVNGDQYPDIVAAMASQGSQVKVISGYDGKELLSFFPYEQSFTGGVYVAVGDVDGDGANEIITGTGNGGSPLVKVLDGTSGKEKFSFFPYENTFRGGVLVNTGDLNGDGRDEIITGTGVGGGPRVVAFDSVSKEAVLDFFAYEDTFRGGVLVGTGDTNGDGRDEIITGTGVGGGPRVQVFDAQKKSLSNFFAYEDSFRGGVLVGTGDINRDGQDEVLTGTGPGGGPVVTAFGSNSKDSLARFLAFDGNFRGGVNVTGADLTGDGFAEIIAGGGPGGDSKVAIFSSDGSKLIRSFSPFDPIVLPNEQFTVPPGSNNPDNSDPTELQPAGTLATSESKVMVGSNEQVIFTARPTAAASRVKLSNANASGAPTSYLLDLFDDGSFVHRDAVAGDGVFSNTFTVNYPSPGSYFYAATATIGGADSNYSTAISAITAPTDAAVNLRTTEAAGYQTQLNALVAAGTPLPQALSSMAATIAGNSAGVAAGSVNITDRGVYWTTPEGLTQGISSGVGNANELSGTSGTGSDGTAAATGADNPDCKGHALVLAPFVWDVGQVGMDTVAQKLKDDGFDVDYQSNAAANSGVVTVDDFKNLGQYDVVAITTHGDRTADTKNTTVILTGEPVTAAGNVKYKADMVAGRIQNVAGYYAVTPSFFTKYTGQMDGTIVYLAACRSAQTNALGNAFLNAGAGAYMGYSDYVGVGFAQNHGVAAFNHLVADKTVGTMPGVGDTETDSDPARFRLYRRNVNAKLTHKCDLLKDFDLFVTYTWPTTQKDLDSGTLFLGETVGYAAPGSAVYMTFSGDDTSLGGKEDIGVNLYGAYVDGKWSATVPVVARAGWYVPAGGSGPATLTVALKNKTTGVLRRAVQRSINPGAQSGLATTVVATATVTQVGTGDHATVSFTLA